ncbi:hypothetical protein N7541_004365 [Penicillium brevicompactum]|uniref:Uncharacterized protein n=1 Tax=Penicillium brevicompactum TaxID=5074 RepID=A0A9W9UTW7_PENBR|nr:hypothetical protein N7541_004365 [Penicillium brevicompactum]
MENIELHPSRRSDLTQSEADILRILNKALTSLVNPAAASATLARSLREHISLQGSQSSQITSATLLELWEILLEVVCIVPIDHPLHEVLIAAVDDLRREGGAVAGSDVGNTPHQTSDSTTSLKWEDQPRLSMYLFDNGQVSKLKATSLFSARNSNIKEDPTDLDDHSSEDIEAWKRFNSFASRLISHDFQSWIVLAYWEIAGGLKTVPQNTTGFECKIWVATEWLIQCGTILFKDLSSTEELDARELASIKSGPLCQDISPHSVQRWDFWQSRLVELTNNKSSNGTALEDFSLSASSLSRLEQAINATHRSRDRVETEGQASRDEDSSETVGN